MRRDIQQLCAVSIASLLLLAGCSNTAASVEKPVNTVTVTQVKESPLHAVYDLSGTLTAWEQSPVSFEINGTVDAVNVDIGDTVTKGQILAQLDHTDYSLQVSKAQQAVQQASAGLEAAQASLSNASAVRLAAQAGVAAAEAQVEVAKSKQLGVLDGARDQEKAQAQNAVSKAQAAYDQAKSAADRANALFENGLLTQQEYEQAQTSFQTAQDTLKDAQAQLSLITEGASRSDRAGAAAAVKQAQTGIQSAQASVQQADAGIQQAQSGVAQAQAAYDQSQVALDQAQLALSKTRLQSEISGVVLTKTVSSGQTIAAGSPVFTIGQMNRLKVLLPVPDEQIGQWKAGQQVLFSLYDEQRTGKVTRIYPQTNENTGTISAEVQIDNPKLDWKPGQVVKASRDVSRRTGIMVPVEAVISVDDSPYIFKDVNGQAVRTDVEIGSLINNQIVVASGLQSGDIVVTSGADRLFDGDSLRQAAQPDRSSKAAEMRQNAPKQEDSNS